MDKVNKMDKIVMPVGYENFEEVRRSGRYYVDKTEILYELVQNEGNKVTLFTRPRRFGKTLTMRMMESFFALGRDSRELFQGLSVMRHEQFCREWMNQFPVIFVTFKDVAHLTFSQAYGCLRAMIADVCKEFAFLEKSDRVNEADRMIFHNLMFECGNETHVENSLKILTRMLWSHFKKPVILFIDEYDVPAAEAQEHGYYKEMLMVIRNMFCAALKTNDYLKFAVVTGCLRISKESIFTGVNHFVSYSVLDDEFCDSFGFTEKEAEELLQQGGLIKHAGQMKEWYDGYMFGSREIYCPWDVVSYVSKLLKNPGSRPKNYWVNTSSNSIIRSFINHQEWNVNDKFEILLNGGTMIQHVSDELTYDQLHDSEDNLWSVLLMTGYLTKTMRLPPGENLTEIKIPNQEIMGIFRQSVTAWFYDSLDMGKARELIQAFWAGEADRTAELISDFLFETISYYDYHEDFYHAFLAGILKAGGCLADSNREQGLGRTDIAVRDRKNRRAAVIEIKRAKSREAMEHACREGMEQILTKEYGKGLTQEYRCVLYYGMAFFQKTCRAAVMEIKRQPCL